MNGVSKSAVPSRCEMMIQEVFQCSDLRKLGDVDLRLALKTGNGIAEKYGYV